MAIITETYAKWTFYLSRETDGVEEETTRTITVPDPTSTEATREQAVNEMQALLRTVPDVGGKTLIQPASWRDDNDSEKEWETYDFKLEFITTTTEPYIYSP